MDNQSPNKKIYIGGNIKKAVERIALKQVYLPIDALKKELNGAGFTFRAESIKKYLYLLVKEGKLYSAGRGWYSNLTKPFILDTQPVEAFIDQVRRQFPLLVFSCWSGAQVQSWFHHLPANLPLFIFVERDALNPVYSFLRDNFGNCYLNPQKREIQQTFRLTKDTVIVRPAISEEPREGNRAPIEKILVDLYIERERLDLFDEWEYQHLFKKIVQQYRVDMAGLFRYAGRRKIKDKIKVLIH